VLQSVFAGHIAGRVALCGTTESVLQGPVYKLPEEPVRRCNVLQRVEACCSAVSESMLLGPVYKLPEELVWCCSVLQCTLQGVLQCVAARRRAVT